jgi:hypothetical protein
VPYVRKGHTVYKKHPDGHLSKKGTSSTVQGAESYMRALHAHEPGKTPKKMPKMTRKSSK